EAAQIQTFAVRPRPEPLLPPVYANWLFATPDCGVPASLGAAARRLCSAAAVRAAAAARSLAARQPLDRARGRDCRSCGVRLDGLHARDPQVAPPPGAPAGQARGRAPARGSRRDSDP